jgi:enoyl-CoA hydratase/carnithine racemase
MHSVRVSRRASTQHWNVRAPIGRSGLSLSLAPDALSLRRRHRGSLERGLGQGAAKIEDSIKPVIMAIHGTALGGGLEVAMAGHYRVAIASAQLGQPEVNLGIIPGAEGTQRLPRLVRVEKAIEMWVRGKPLKAADALTAGLIDAVIEGDLLTVP